MATRKTIVRSTAKKASVSPSKSTTAVERLMDLLRAPGPSGYEQRAARVWRAQAEDFADEVTVDTAGNSFAVVNPAGGMKADTPTILLAAHIDEIGMIITRISDEGFLHCDPIGGWDTQVLVGQRVTILGANGDVQGVVGQAPVHMQPEDEDPATGDFRQFWVDIGAGSKREAERRVRTGDAMVITAEPTMLNDKILTSRCLDNRLGCSVVLETLRAYAARPGAARVVAVANTQEEIAQFGGGAKMASEQVNPTVAVVIDVMSALDQPITLETEHRTDCSLGDGPFIARGAGASPVVFQRMEQAARRLGIDYGILALGEGSSSDMEGVALARSGVPTTLISVPLRYMHSPSETIALVDIKNTIRLTTAFCQSIKAGMDWRVL